MTNSILTDSIGKPPIDILFNLSLLCKHDAHLFVKVADLFLEALTQQTKLGFRRLKSQDYLTQLTSQLIRVGGDIQVVSRERAYFELLAGAHNKKLISALLASDGVEDADPRSNKTSNMPLR